MSKATIDKTAAQIRDAYESGTPCPPIRNGFDAGDVSSAYAVQEANTGYWRKQGRRLVGRKIGLTSPAVQEQLGVDQPDYGALFADMAVADGEPIPESAVLQPRVEAEIALVLEADLTMERPMVVDVIRATDFAVPAIEVVGSRIANWDIGIVDTIADNASSGLFVVGSPARTLDGLDLRAIDMTLSDGGEVVSQGSGAACLGNPLIAAAWLAGRMVEVGTPLQAGDIILTGALGPMKPAERGKTYEATLSGLGSVRAAFA